MKNDEELQDHCHAQARRDHISELWEFRFYDQFCRSRKRLSASIERSMPKTSGSDWLPHASAGLV